MTDAPEPTLEMIYARQVVERRAAEIAKLKGQIVELIEEIADCQIYLSIHGGVPAKDPDGKELSLLERIALLCARVSHA